MELNGCHVVAARSTHAVQAAMFVLELPAEISSEIIQKVLSHYESSTVLKDFFPLKTENRGMHINISDEAIGVNRSSDIQGVTLQRVATDGTPEFVFSMQANLISFTCNKYTKWKDVSLKAVEFLLEFTKFIIPLPGIAVIALQYVDEFVVTGNVKEFRGSILFDKNATRLPSAMLEEKEFWHSHTGWFSINEKENRILNNLNINYYPQSLEKSAVQIISAHKEILTAPITLSLDLRTLLFNTFETLYSLNKIMFKEILNDETLKSINLG